MRPGQPTSELTTSLCKWCGSVHVPLEVGTLLKRLEQSSLPETSFPKKCLCMLLDGVLEGNCLCAWARLSLTNEPYHQGGSALSLTLSGAGSFMENKLIIHTKLHLQETFGCILQSSKMIRFTFYSRGLVTPSSRHVLNLRSASSAHAELAFLNSYNHGHRDQGDHHSG